MQEVPPTWREGSNIVPSEKHYAFKNPRNEANNLCWHLEDNADNKSTIDALADELIPSCRRCDISLSVAQDGGLAKLTLQR